MTKEDQFWKPNIQGSRVLVKKAKLSLLRHDWEHFPKVSGLKVAPSNRAHKQPRDQYYVVSGTN